MRRAPRPVDAMGSRSIQTRSRAGLERLGRDAGKRRRQSAAAAGISAQQLPHLELKWAFGFPDATSSWAQPTVVGGWVFVGSQNGTVYALDAGTRLHPLVFQRGRRRAHRDQRRRK